MLLRLQKQHLHILNGHQCHCRRSSPLSQTVRFMTQYLSLWAITFHNKVTGDVSTIREMATTEGCNPLQYTRAKQTDI